PEHRRQAEEPGVEGRLAVVGGQAEVDGAREAPVEHAAGLVEGDLPEQVEGVVVPGSHAVPGVLRGHAPVAGDPGAAEEPSGLAVGLVHRDLMAEPGELVCRAEPGDAGPEYGHNPGHDGVPS